MARQSGLIKLEGEMGGITFYKTKDGYLAREATSISTDRLKSDPAFERTRENNREFSAAANAGKILRNALRNSTVGVSDGRAISRMFKAMMRAVKADVTNDRGKRNAVDGELGFLQGFNFNGAAELTAVFKAQFISRIDRVGGSLSISIEPFIPSRMIVAPEGATHFRLVSAGADIDFVTGEYTSASAASVELPLGNNTVPAQSLESLIPPGSTQPLFLTFGIEFFQIVNGKYYGLKNGAYNSVAITAVNTLQ